MMFFNRNSFLGIPFVFFTVFLSACGGSDSSSSESKQTQHTAEVPDKDGDGIRDEYDCAPSDSSKWKTFNYQYEDLDNDNVLVKLNEIQSICIESEAPKNLFAKSENKKIDDCDDQDASVFIRYHYRYVDLDTDKHVVKLDSIQQVCGGAKRPTGYLQVLDDSHSIGDCDDSKGSVYRQTHLFEDLDDDGYGSNNMILECIGSDVPKGYSLTNGDCDDSNGVQFINHDYRYRDQDLDSHWIQLERNQYLCAGEQLPPDYALTIDFDHLGDCNDNNPSAYRSIWAYQDSDRDGYGAGFGNYECIGESLPEQLSLIDGDCNDTDAELYQRLNYFYRDQDADLHVVATGLRSICSGTALPPTYLFDLPAGYEVGDCDDSVATGKEKYREVELFTDTDGDSYGGESAGIQCIGNGIPEGFVSYSNDCDDDNKDAYRMHQYRFTDEDNDTYWVEQNETKQVCGGDSIPSGYALNVSSEKIGDCDAGDAEKFHAKTLYEDKDGDRYGIGNAISMCIGDSLPERYALNNTDCDDSDTDAFKLHKYNYEDKDFDKRYVYKIYATACAGETLPEGLHIDPIREYNYFDCDDSDSKKYKNYQHQYLDLDLDKHAVKQPSKQYFCAGDERPSTHILELAADYSEGDCDDHPDTGNGLYQTKELFEDIDGDGWGTESNGERCVGIQPPEGVAFNQGDCAPNDNERSHWHEYKYVDNDLDGHWVENANSEIKQICSSEGAPLFIASSVEEQKIGDCDDEDFARFRDIPLFKDEDKDGIGAGEASQSCVGERIPEGFSMYETDCNDADGLIYQMLEYDLVDSDGDGSYVPVDPNGLCSGSKLPPELFYLGEPLPKEDQDCNDSDKNQYMLVNYYRDEDGDGIGGVIEDSMCGSRIPPEGYSASSTDCDDDDHTSWQLLYASYIDNDLDGFFTRLPEPEYFCSRIRLPEKYTNSFQEKLDCDDTDQHVFKKSAFFKDNDNDGVGSTLIPPRTFCIGYQNPEGYSPYGGDLDDNDASIQQAHNESELLLIK